MVGIQKDRHAKAAQGDGAYVWATARVPWLGGPPKRKLCNKLYTIQKTHIRNKNNVWARKAFLAWKAVRNFIGKKKQRALLIRAGCNGKKQEESLPPLKTTDILKEYQKCRPPCASGQARHKPAARFPANVGTRQKGSHALWICLGIVPSPMGHGKFHCILSIS